MSPSEIATPTVVPVTKAPTESPALRAHTLAALAATAAALHTPDRVLPMAALGPVDGALGTPKVVHALKRTDSKATPKLGKDMVVKDFQTG